MPALLTASAMLARREVVRFFRQRSRVIGAVVPPLIFWFFIGTGLGDSFRHGGSGAGLSGGMNYLQYFLPGTIVMIVLFAAIFSTISIIEDRKEGFLQAVLVSPAPRMSIVLGKIAGGAGIAFLQGLVFLVLAPLVGVRFTAASLLYLLAALSLASFSLTGLGFLIAWRMDSTQGFHSIMNLFLLPMWFLSGALFPAAGAPGWLRILMRANPLTYSVESVRYGFYSSGPAGGFPGPWLCLGAALAFCLVTFLISLRVCLASSGEGA